MSTTPTKKKKRFLFFGKRKQKKLVHEISLNFPELFIIGKYVKIRFKNRDHPAIFAVLEINRSKILQKLNKTDLHNKYMT